MKPITHKGRPVTPEEIQALADEAEAGIEILQLKRRPGGPSIGSAAADVFPVQLDVSQTNSDTFKRMLANEMKLISIAVSASCKSAN